MNTKKGTNPRHVGPALLRKRSPPHLRTRKRTPPPAGMPCFLPAPATPAEVSRRSEKLLNSRNGSGSSDGSAAARPKRHDVWRLTTHLGTVNVASRGQK